jgi:hypothetical protein
MFSSGLVVLDYCRQRPTLPHSFPCSTIGGSRLNFRVRNGNGCDPAPMTTGILIANCRVPIANSIVHSQSATFNQLPGVPPPLASASYGARAVFIRPARRSAVEGAKVGRPKQSCQRPSTEYPANGSFAKPPRTQRVLHARHDPKTVSYKRDCCSRRFGDRRERKYGQASRLISIGQLNVLPRFHTRPIAWSSSRSLQGSCDPGRSHLVEGFTLRCLQRFSLPDVATRRCRWRDNRYTRGPSNPVLSY